MINKELKIHEAANAFPMIPDPEFKALVADVEASGLLCPIELHKGKIIDGRHRYRACLSVGIEPEFVEANLGEQSPAEYVWSLNGLRRHLTASQRAAIAVELLPQFEVEAKDRQSRLNGKSQLVEKFPQAELGKSRDKAAETVGVNPHYISDAKRIKEQSPDIFSKLKTGEISLTDAKNMPHVSNNSCENEWYTPPEFVEAARKVLNVIELDPATSKLAQQTVKAKRFYTVDDDGLSKRWRGNVWMNPPYEKGLIDAFIDKLIEHHEAGDVKEAVCLVNNATETNWFQRGMRSASAGCFPKGRIKFLDSKGNPKNTPLQGQGFLYFGDFTDDFEKSFSRFGRVWI